MHTTSSPDVFEVMHQLVHAYRTQMLCNIQLTHPELTLNEMRALMFVGTHPGVTQRELAAHSGADKGLIARLVGSLIDKGWLFRELHETDKRSNRLILSAEGAAIYQSLHVCGQAISSTLLSGLDHRDQRQLLTLAYRAASNIETLPEML